MILPVRSRGAFGQDIPAFPSYEARVWLCLADRRPQPPKVCPGQAASGRIPLGQQEFYSRGSIEHFLSGEEMTI